MSKTPKYKLYYNKKENIIRLEKQGANPLTIYGDYDTNGVVKYKDCYYLSNDRNALIDKAMELKYAWILEYESAINKLAVINYKKAKEKKGE